MGICGLDGKILALSRRQTAAASLVLGQRPADGGTALDFAFRLPAQSLSRFLARSSPGIRFT